MCIAKDKNGKEWNLEITMALARRVLKSDYSEILGDENVPVNLIDINRTTLELLSHRDSLLVAVCYTILYDQIEVVSSPEKSIPELKEETFLSLVDGEFRLQLKTKFWEALVAFNPETKEDLLNFKERMQELKDHTKKTMKEMAPELERVLQEHVRNAINDLSKTLKPSG